MRPRQSFLGDPGDLDKGTGPRAPLLEGARCCRLGTQVWQARSAFSQALGTQSPPARGAFVSTQHFTWEMPSTPPTSLSPRKMEQIQSVTLAFRPPWGKGLGHRRINDMGTRARHHFSGVGFSMKLQSGLLPNGVLMKVHGNQGAGFRRGALAWGAQTTLGIPGLRGSVTL